MNKNEPVSAARPVVFFALELIVAAVVLAAPEEFISLTSQAALAFSYIVAGSQSAADSRNLSFVPMSAVAFAIAHAVRSLSGRSPVGVHPWQGYRREIGAKEVILKLGFGLITGVASVSVYLNASAILSANKSADPLEISRGRLLLELFGIWIVALMVVDALWTALTFLKQRTTEQ